MLLPERGCERSKSKKAAFLCCSFLQTFPFWFWICFFKAEKTQQELLRVIFGERKKKQAPKNLGKSSVKENSSQTGWKSLLRQKKPNQQRQRQEQRRIMVQGHKTKEHVWGDQNFLLLLENLKKEPKYVPTYLECIGCAKVI